MRANLQALFIVGIVTIVMISCSKKAAIQPRATPPDSTHTGTTGGTGGMTTTDVYVAGSDNGKPWLPDLVLDKVKVLSGLED
jgi:hypothetical protein